MFAPRGILREPGEKCFRGNHVKFLLPAGGYRRDAVQVWGDSVRRSMSHSSVSSVAPRSGFADRGSFKPDVEYEHLDEPRVRNSSVENEEARQLKQAQLQDLRTRDDIRGNGVIAYTQRYVFDALRLSRRAGYTRHMLDAVCVKMLHKVYKEIRYGTEIPSGYSESALTRHDHALEQRLLEEEASLREVERRIAARVCAQERSRARGELEARKQNLRAELDAFVTDVLGCGGGDRLLEAVRVRIGLVGERRRRRRERHSVRMR